MLADYSVTALLEFLDYLGDKGLANKNTVSARKASANKMLSILDEEEKADLRDVDVGELSKRFGNLQGTNYTPESLQVYKSRTNAAISDFMRYKENPATFRMEAGNGKSPQPKSGTGQTSAATNRPATKSEAPPRTLAVSRPASFDVPVPLRPGSIVQINGIPVDLTAEEAKKIANVVMAFAAVVSDAASLP